MRKHDMRGTLIPDRVASNYPTVSPTGPNPSTSRPMSWLNVGIFQILQIDSNDQEKE